MRDGWKSGFHLDRIRLWTVFRQASHLDQNQFTIYHGGYLAIDSGADYTDTESPHYLNYYRRTVAHNSILVYDPAEKFFWSDNLFLQLTTAGSEWIPPATGIPSVVLKTGTYSRPLGLGSMRVVDYVPGHYHYALGRCQQRLFTRKLRRFTREILYVPDRVLLVFRSSREHEPFFSKSLAASWSESSQSWTRRLGAETQGVQKISRMPMSSALRRIGRVAGALASSEGANRHPARRAGNEFYTPGDDHGGVGNGENWPLNRLRVLRLPDDPKLRAHVEDCFGVKTSTRFSVRIARM